MLLDKLSWVEHEGAIYSVHAQPGGGRFATAGFDQKVKIWNLAAALDAKVESKPTTHKLLATLVEHNGAVNAVRFSNDGKLLASGSDDTMVIVYHLTAGVGGAVLGSTTHNVENWRPKLFLRGHSTNVADLAWSHDSTKLATAGMDSNLMVWDASNGHRLATLTSQNSFVKGVQWDPVGSYLAAQSDDRSVVVYQTSDWAPLAVISDPFQRMISDTFATRLAFSPDGQSLLAGNSLQKGHHCAVVVPREQWHSSRDILFLAGHTGAVVSTAFNPKMFHLLEGAEQEGGSGNGAAFREELTAVFATGDMSSCIAVWSAGTNRPIFTGKKFFRSGVLDLCWTSDGYALLACSGEGSVVVFQFSEGELGKACSGEEMEEVMGELYGSRARAVGGRPLFAESVDQLEEEEPPRNHATAPVQQQRQQQPAGPELPKPRQPLAEAGHAPLNRIAPEQRAAAKPPLSKPGSSLDALQRLEGRLKGVGEVSEGFAAPSNTAASARPAPVRSSDGRKRLVPEVLGEGVGGSSQAALSQQHQAAAPQQRTAGVAAAAPAAKRQRAGPANAAEVAAAGGGEALGAGGPPQASHAGALGYPPCQPVLLPPPPVKPDWRVRLRGQQAVVAALEGEQAAEPQRQHILDLRVVNRERAAGGKVQAELSCLRGDSPLWTDVAPGAVLCACGTTHFAAAGLEDGSVMLYSPAGRRLGGSFKLGAGIARMACDAGWLLLCLTTSGRVKLVHVGEMRALLTASVAQLVEDGSRVVDARLSRQGWPILTLTSHRAFMYHPGLEEWMCAAEEGFAASPYLPTLRLQKLGELAGLQAEVLGGCASAQPRALLTAQPATQQQQSRAMLETNLAAALCLRSPQEYRRWLGTYAQLLAESGDEGRLRELCMELLGDPLAPAAPGPASEGARGEGRGEGGEGRGQGGGDAPMAEAQASYPAAAATAQGREGSWRGIGPPLWEPTLLGLDKREELLEGEVLRVVSRSRVLGGLAAEMRDLLEDCRRMG